jgi:hypothetical protein
VRLHARGSALDFASPGWDAFFKQRYFRIPEAFEMIIEIIAIYVLVQCISVFVQCINVLARVIGRRRDVLYYVAHPNAG